MRNTFTKDINATPDKVFYWLDDSQRVMEWASMIVENEDLEVTPERVGSTFRQVTEEKGRKMEFQGKVTGYEKDKMIRVYLEGSAFNLDVEYVLEPLAAGGTKLTQNSEVKMKGIWILMMPLMMLFAKKAMEESCLNDFDKLAALAEGMGGSGA